MASHSFKKLQLRLALIAVVSALLAGPAFGMFEKPGASARSEGMAGAFTAVADEPGAHAVNPAGLALVPGTQFSGAYGLLFGGLGTNLHTGNAAFSQAAGRFGTAGLAVVETGFELHSERTLRLAHGLFLARDLAFGYGVSGYNLYQRDIGSGYSWGLDLGMLARLYRVWSVGFAARNLNMPRLGTGAEAELPVRLAFGVAYRPQAGITSALDVSKEPGQSTRVSVGQEFRIVPDFLTLRCGVQTAPVRMAAGLRTGFRNVQVDYALKTHPMLPLEHLFGLAVRF
ncbi:MAG: hypothetical protein R6X14_08885 [bacterium]